MVTQTMGNIGCLVCNSALGQTGKLYQQEVDRLLKACGPEWTCKRLKAIRSAALSLRDGKPEEARGIYAQNSIAYHKDSMLPKGAAKNVVKSFVNARKPSAVKRCDAVLRVYTSIRLKEPSCAQVNKALGNICNASKAKAPKAYMSVIKDEVDRLFADPAFSKKVALAQRFLSKPLGPNEIHAEHLKSTSTYYSRYKVPTEMRMIPYSSMAMSFMTEPWVPESLDKYVPCFEMREQDVNSGWGLGCNSSSQKYAGKISLIQEQGAKARVVAMPTAWLQLSFMPWHNRLAQVAEFLFPEQSCVRDQAKGVHAALNHNNCGGQVSCTDLSAATDRFPVELSLHIARRLGMDEYADALQDVVDQPFKCDFAPNGEVRYGVGQPMGLYSSFPLFHLSNAVVAELATQDAKDLLPEQPNLFPDGSSFRCLGDDIIFSDVSISKFYEMKLQNLGVDISREKSYDNGVFEFAGFIGFKSNRKWHAYRPYKVPDAKYVTNPVQFLDSLGVKVSQVSPKWEQTFKDYQRTRSSRDIDLTPILPTWEDKVIGDSRGDNRTLVNLCNVLQMELQGLGYTTPEVATINGRPTTRINTVPLFRERGMFDYYQFDPDILNKAERTRPNVAHVHKNVYQDPLMREARDERNGVVSVKQLLPKTKSESKDLESPPKADSPSLEHSLVPENQPPQAVLDILQKAREIDSQEGVISNGKEI